MCAYKYVRFTTSVFYKRVLFNRAGAWDKFVQTEISYAIFLKVKLNGQGNCPNRIFKRKHVNKKQEKHIFNCKKKSLERSSCVAGLSKNNTRRIDNLPSV